MANSKNYEQRFEEKLIQKKQLINNNKPLTLWKPLMIKLKEEIEFNGCGNCLKSINVLCKNCKELIGKIDFALKQNPEVEG